MEGASVEDPVGLESRYLTAWRLAVDFVFDYPDPPLALLLSGSVARGEADPGSDLDIFVITDGDHRQRVQRIFAGVPCELFINPTRRVPRYFEEEAQEGRSSTLGLVLDGRIMYDPHDTMPELHRLAAMVRARGPQVSDAAIEFRRYGAIDHLDNARDVHGRDPLMSQILTSGAVKEAMRLAFVLASEWTPRDKDLHRELVRLRPDAAEPLSAYATEPGPVTATAVLDRLIGVSSFFEWETEPEAV